MRVAGADGAIAGGAVIEAKLEIPDFFPEEFPVGLAFVSGFRDAEEEGLENDGDAAEYGGSAASKDGVRDFHGALEKDGFADG